MLDSLSILLSCVACIFVAWRAGKLDGKLPWFTRVERPLSRPGSPLPGIGPSPAGVGDPRGAPAPGRRKAG